MELGYSFGFTNHLVDDIWLGYRSGKQPDVVVMDAFRYLDEIHMMSKLDPVKYHFVTDLLTKYEPVFQCPGYVIYARFGLPIAPAATKTSNKMNLR